MHVSIDQRLGLGIAAIILKIPAFHVVRGSKRRSPTPFFLRGRVRAPNLPFCYRWSIFSRVRLARPSGKRKYPQASQRFQGNLAQINTGVKHPPAPTSVSARIYVYEQCNMHRHVPSELFRELMRIKLQNFHFRISQPERQRRVGGLTAPACQPVHEPDLRLALSLSRLR